MKCIHALDLFKNSQNRNPVGNAILGTFKVRPLDLYSPGLESRGVFDLLSNNDILKGHNRKSYNPKIEESS